MVSLTWRICQSELEVLTTNHYMVSDIDVCSNKRALSGFLQGFELELVFVMMIYQLQYMATGIEVFST